MNSKGNLLKVHDVCPNPKCRCQKQIIFTPNQKHFEKTGYEDKRRNFFKGTQTAWNKFINLGLQIVTPLTSAAVTATTENPQTVQETNKSFKSIGACKTLDGLTR